MSPEVTDLYMILMLDGIIHRYTCSIGINTYTYMHTEYYSAMKREGNLVICDEIEFQSIMLSQTSQFQYMIIHLSNMKTLNL